MRWRKRQGASAWLAVVAVWILGASAAHSLSESARAQVEADWERQDASWMQQLAQPTTFRFPDAVVQWPGLRSASGTPIPMQPTPQVDGDLSDPGWAGALAIPGTTPADPSFRLMHDARRLYLAAELPQEAEARFRGERTALDASGAVDGVKNGRYGFHTGGDANPWWQVDLGGVMPVRQVVVYNRLDYAPGLNNANNLVVLVSDDEVQWQEVYRNPGTFFGGVDATGPLRVELKDVSARFVRLQVASNGSILFHLDEVEVCGDDPGRNLALFRPAKQSSLSVWSRGGPAGTSLADVSGVAVGLSSADPPQVLLNDQPVADSAAVRRNGRLVVEAALAMPMSPVLRLGAAEPFAAAFIAGWTVSLAGEARLGYGHNRVEVEVGGTPAFDPPVSVTVDVQTLTPFGIRKSVGDAQTISRPGRAPLTVDVLREGPSVLQIRARQGEFEVADDRPFMVHPVADTIQRGRAILAALGRRAPEGYADLAARMVSLAEREVAEGPDPETRAALYREARWAVREIAFSRPELTDGELLFVRKFTQQAYPDVCLNHMPWVSRPGGDLCALSPIAPDGQVRPILNGRLGPGHVHGIDLSYDGRRVVFGYAPAASDQPPDGWLDRTRSYDLRRTVEPIHIYEVGVDGTGLRQITDSEWSDLDPCYLPNGDIAFVSERCGYSLQCNEYDKDETSCNLYVVHPDGTGVRRMSVTKDGDYLPQVLDNGLLAYTRWEYQERSFANIQSIWVINPDGAFADALFKQHFNDPWAIEEPRSIPGSGKLLAIATGHHTLAVGPLILVDNKVGVNEPAGIRLVTPGTVSPEGGMNGLAVPEGGVSGGGGLYASPWPLSETTFLVSYTYNGMTDETGYSLYLVDVHGTRELIFDDPEMSCFDPMPLASRTQPMVMADTRLPGIGQGTFRSNPGDDEPVTSPLATCVVTDVYDGLAGIERGRIRYLRISQGLAWPYTIKGGGERYEPDVKSSPINWTPTRVLGTVPVEPDGSAHFQVPADVAVYFQALDAGQMELRRMRSFISLQPGEQRSCSGCHETRGVAPASARVPLAVQRGPSPLTPPPWGDRAISFLRDVQPVLDRNCVSCHSGFAPAGGLDFSGGLTASRNRAWDTITGARLVARSYALDDARITEPLQFGSHKSKLIEVLGTTHRDRVHLLEEDHLRLVMWVDANGPYHARFIDKRPERPAYDLVADEGLRQAILDVSSRRCASCHEPTSVSRMDWIDLGKPERSRFLAAPLARDAGGEGRCSAAVYETDGDADYQALLARVAEAVERAWALPRRDVATLEPPAWARESVVARAAGGK